jgi:hypothetical protein
MLFIDYIQRHPEILAGLVGLTFVINVVTFYVGGRRAERRFETPWPQQIRFNERGASGYSNKSLLTKLGGARGVLEVVVTDADLRIKGIWPPLSYIGTKFDLTHRFPRSQVRSVQARDNAIELRFMDEAGAESHVVLRLKAPQAFMTAMGA